MEIFTFMRMGGDLDRIDVELISHSDQDEAAAREGLKASLATFDAAKAQCFKQEDRQRLSWLKCRPPCFAWDHLKPQAAPTHPGAQPEQLASLPWPHSSPKREDLPLATPGGCSLSLRPPLATFTISTRACGTACRFEARPPD